ncbi:hypothetical protein [Phenylobacterium sp.]|uniref:hypothetical protein n=1 Tax=Phenylobacterium sp. TaxID=1871053 RepID=UPI002FCA01F1
MTNSKAERLKRELLSLYLRYGQATFREVLDQFRDGSALAGLPEVLAEIERSGPSRVRTRRTPARSFPDREDSTPAEIAASGHPDARKIADFYVDVTRGKLLRTPRALRGYAAQIGVELPNKTPSRSVLAKEFARRLLTMRDSARQDFLMLGERHDAEESSLRGWSDLIVKP